LYFLRQHLANGNSNLALQLVHHFLREVKLGKARVIRGLSSIVRTLQNSFQSQILTRIL